jgi:hypothetical protein
VSGWVVMVSYVRVVMMQALRFGFWALGARNRLSGVAWGCGSGRGAAILSGTRSDTRTRVRSGRARPGRCVLVRSRSHHYSIKFGRYVVILGSPRSEIR